MALSDLLDDRCDVQRVSYAVSTKGARTATWSTILSRIRCRVRTLSAEEVAQYGTLDRVATHVVYTATTQPSVGPYNNMIAILTSSPAGLTSAADRQQAGHRIKHSINGRA